MKVVRCPMLTWTVQHFYRLSRKKERKNIGHLNVNWQPHKAQRVKHTVWAWKRECQGRPSMKKLPQLLDTGGWVLLPEQTAGRNGWSLRCLFFLKKKTHGNPRLDFQQAMLKGPPEKKWEDRRDECPSFLCERWSRARSNLLLIFLSFVGEALACFSRAFVYWSEIFVVGEAKVQSLVLGCCKDC